MEEAKIIYLPVNEIFIRQNKRFKSSSKHKREDCYGLDTETYQGKCALICDSEGRSLYRGDFDSDKEFFDEILEFLFYRINWQTYRFFFNIEFDFSAILKASHLTANQIIEIYQKKLFFYENDNAKYSILYFPRSFLKITKYDKNKKRYAKYTKIYTDLFPFYKKSLDKSAKTHLNMQKIKEVERNKLNTERDYWKKNLSKIIFYCRKDAELTKQLGNFLLSKIKKAHLKLPRYLSSIASLAKENFRYYARIPSIKYVPPNILDIAQACYFAHRFELLKRGHFTKIVSYDLNSAYPATMRNLPSLKYGRWDKTQEIKERECIAFYKVHAKIPDDLYITPLPFKYDFLRGGNRKTKSPLCVFPSGEIVTWVTWYEADLLRRFDCLKKVFNGYEYKPFYSEYKPFLRIIDVLYAQKEFFKKKDDFVSDLSKGTINTPYGCFCEKHEIPDMEDEMGGVLFNPIYASIIPSATRYRLLNFIKEKDFSNLIGFNADSILSTKKLNLPISKSMGDFSLKEEGEGWVINTGRLQIGDNCVKHRGFEKGKNKLNWKDLLLKNLDKKEIEIPKKHCISMKESLLRHHDERDVNIFIDRYTKLDINRDNKRIWERKFEDCRDLFENNLDSKPLKIDFFCDFTRMRYLK